MLLFYSVQIFFLGKKRRERFELMTTYFITPFSLKEWLALLIGSFQKQLRTMPKAEKGILRSIATDI